MQTTATAGDSKKVVVIGAGLGGLAAASFLQMNGYAAQVLDAAPRSGGVALTRWDDTHRVEGGIYFFIEHAPGTAAYAMYRSLGLVPADDVETIDCYVRLIDEKSGAHLDVTRDLDRLRRDLLSIGPDDVAIVDRLIAGARAFARTDPVKAGFEKPPELQGLFDKLALVWHTRNALSVFSNKVLLESTMTEWLANMKSDQLRTLLLHLFPHPTVAPWFVMMLLGLLAQGQMGRLTSSADAFVSRLVARLRELGGQEEHGTRVRRILVENGKARGVELEDGTVREAHAVVATIDTEQLHDVLLEGKCLDATTRERLDAWPRTVPVAFVHFVTEARWENEIWLQQVLLERPLVDGASRLVSLRFLSGGVAGAGPDECVVQVCLDVDAGWLSSDTETKRANEAALVEGTLALLERRLPGFSLTVRYTEVVMPDLFARVVSAPRGVTNAWLPTPKALMAQSPRRVPGVDHLYLAGQWAVAGAGILAVLYSGRHAAQLLCHDDGRPFVMA